MTIFRSKILPLPAQLYVEKKAGKISINDEKENKSVYSNITDFHDRNAADGRCGQVSTLSQTCDPNGTKF